MDMCETKSFTDYKTEEYLSFVMRIVFKSCCSTDFRSVCVFSHDIRSVRGHRPLASLWVKCVVFPKLLLNEPSNSVDVSASFTPPTGWFPGYSFVFAATSSKPGYDSSTCSLPALGFKPCDAHTSRHLV